MLLARVIGTVWATRKYDDLDGATMQLIQPLSSELQAQGRPLAQARQLDALEDRVVERVIPGEQALA
jgi:microcompartment protein CcmK/EutM